MEAPAVEKKTSWRRRLIHFALSVLVATVLGIGVERLLKEEELRHVLEFQASAFQAVSAFDPWELSKTVVEATQDQAPSLLEPSHLPNRGAAPGDRFGPRDLTITFPGPPPPTKTRAQRFAGWAKGWPWPLAFPIALADVLWHLATTGTNDQKIITGLQCLIGFGLSRALISQERDLNFGGLIVFVPLGVVLGSLSALALQGLMIAGLYLLGGVTQLGALATGSGGMAFMAYMLVVKAIEVKTHEAATSIVEKV